MKKVKVLIAILLVFAVVFALVGCNKDDAGSGGTTTGGGTTDSGSTGGGSTGGGSTGGGSTGSGTTSGGTTSGGATGGGEKEWVSYTLGTSGWLGRFLQGANPSESMTACDGVYDTVLRIDPLTRQYTSAILKNWYWEDDTTFVMEMRDDVYFSNGDNAIAEDILYSYWAIPQRGSGRLINHGIIFEDSYARDKYTAVFKIERPYYNFVGYPVYLLDKAWATSRPEGEQDMDWYDPVGSGPYYVYEYINDSHIILRSRGEDAYWNKEAGPIYVDEWIIKYYPDSSAIYMALQVGEVDYADIAAMDYARYMDQGGSPDYTARGGQIGSTVYFSFQQQTTDMWKDKRLREAVGIGVNWDEVGAVSMYPSYLPALSIASSLYADYVELGRHEFNPEKARELMSEAGYGPNNRMTVHMITFTSNPYKDASEVIQFYMADFYMDLVIEYRDNAGAIGAFLDPTQEDLDCSIFLAFGGSPVGDLVITVSEIPPEQGFTWCSIYDDIVLNLFATLKSETDPAKRSQAAKDLQRRIFDEYYYIPIAEWMSSFGWRNASFTEQQVMAYRGSGNYIQISRFGMASAWN